MLENIKVSILVLIFVMVPVTAWHAVDLYFSVSCDPKFGCLGVFKLLALITLICAIVSTLAVSLSHCIFTVCGNFKLNRKTYYFLVGFCIALSILTAVAIDIAEDIGVGMFIVIWSLVSFIGSAWIFIIMPKIIIKPSS